MTQREAETLFDRLIDSGFSGGIDCACYCLDGHFGIRSAKAGQPKSPAWAVSCTPMDRTPILKEVIGAGQLTAARFSKGTFYITGWTP